MPVAEHPVLGDETGPQEVRSQAGPEGPPLLGFVQGAVLNRLGPDDE